MTNSLSQALKQALEKKGFQASPPDKAPPLGRNKQPQSPSKPAPAEEPMTAKFHNPYHFVPVNHEEARRGQWLAKKDFLTPPKDTDYWSHARYATATGSYHGRILCKLTTITPIFIGAGRSKGTEDAPGVVQPFTLRESPGLHKKPPDCQDLPAIPASSLRGLISSVAEAASNSALRVLEDRLLSRRMLMKESLNALGMLQKKTNSEELELLPLTLPPLPCDEHGVLKGRVPQAWRTLFKAPNLKVYVNGYARDRNNNPAVLKNSFLGQREPHAYSADNVEYWYLEMGAPSAWMKDKICVSGKKFQIKKIIDWKQTPHYFLTGQHPEQGTGDPISQDEFNGLSAPEQKKYTKGILRILGIKGREGQIPAGKKHEIFIPLPEGISSNQPLAVGKALSAFHILADQRTQVDPALPFTLKGSRGKDVLKLRLKEHDLVFFNLEDVNSLSPKVQGIALASIWRQQAGGTVFDFFAPLKRGTAEHDREMLPMHPKRTMISPAEMVFGFVETQEQGTANADQALAYAGRVRFSHALFEPKNDQERGTPFLPEVTLKILDKPKPPCPAMYFTQRNSRVEASYIPKQKLDSQGHKPQGRKFYLHHREEEVQKSCWKTHYDEAFFKESTTLSKKDLSEEKLKKGRFKQKVVITPIPAGRTFCFHVDFDNLTTYELGMLLYALQPNASFQHKIGMGKPLGLGSVSIEAVAVESIDRKGRYLISDIFNEPRYAESWRQHQEEHPGEASTPTEGSTPKLSVGEVKKEFEETMLPEIKYALETIGNPACVRQRVHTPLRSSQRGGEEEVSTYQWFSKNDDKNNNSKQCLAPITPENSSKEAGVVQGILPTLRRN